MALCENQIWVKGYHCYNNKYIPQAKNMNGYENQKTNRMFANTCLSFQLPRNKPTKELKLMDTFSYI